MIFRFIFLCALLLFIEFYSYQAFRTLIKLKWVLTAYQVISLFVLVFIIYSFSQVDRSVGQTKQFMFTTGLMLLVYVPKIVLTLIMFGEDIIRVGASILNYCVYNTPRKEMMPDRRKFISQIDQDKVIEIMLNDLDASKVLSFLKEVKPLSDSQNNVSIDLLLEALLGLKLEDVA